MTLPYALAKELKDAGWPQPYFDLDEYRPTYRGEFIWEREPTKNTSGEGAYSPSLSELIEGCPKDYDIEQHQDTFSLTYAYGNDGKWGWFAGYEWLGDRGVDLLPCFGETPEEAVARLWLKLKKGEAV